MIGYYLIQKCKKKIEDNYALLAMKLSDPSSLVSVNASGALVDAAAGGMAGLAAFAEDYLAKNSDALLLEALKATGLEKNFLEAYNLAMNMMAMALMARNNLVLRMLQECARSCMDQLSEKDKKLIILAEKTKELYAALSSLVATPHLWQDYYKTLRDALKLIAESRADIQMVRNTLSKTDNWLGKKFDGTVGKLEKAKELITPTKNNPAVDNFKEGVYKLAGVLGTPRSDKTKTPEQRSEERTKREKMHKDGAERMKTGLAYFGVGLADNFPFPTTAQQWQATLAVAKLSGQVVVAMQDYLSETEKCNLLIAAFKVGLDGISTALPAFLKKFVLGLLDTAYGRLDGLTQSMALVLNGKETAIKGPVGGFRTNNLSVSVNSFKWIMDINLILQGYKLIPSKTLNNLSLANKPVEFYRNCVAKLNRMNGTKSGLAQLFMKAAEEDSGALSTQMLAFLLEANNAVVGADVRKEILAVGRAILGRLELSLKIDSEIHSIMDQFAHMELPDNELLDQMFGGIMSMFASAGLDRAAGLLMSGDYKKLFGLNAREASYVGAALAALAMLKNCFKTKAEKDQADNIYSSLKSDSDLLNISFSINFDLSIFKNLLACLQLMDLSKLFSLQELLCGIVNDILGSGGTPSESMKSFDKVGSIFST